MSLMTAIAAFGCSRSNCACATWIFAIAPLVGITATVAAATLFPLGGAEASVSFTGDVILFFYLLGAARFFTVLAARDVASAFPDMGSAREVQFSALVEAIVFALIAFLALMINIRYAAYALPFIGEFKTYPRALRNYLVFGLTDETYAILLQCPFAGEKTRQRYFFWVTAFDHAYWIVGGIAGALIGKNLRFDTSGIDFAMTALFLVILVEQCRDKSNRIPAFTGGAITAGIGALCLGFFPGHIDKMLFPAMACIVVVLLKLRKKGEGATR